MISDPEQTLGFAALVTAYVPLIAFQLTNGKNPEQSSGQSIEGMVNSTSSLGDYLFTVITYPAVPLAITMFYVGVFVRLLAVKIPGRKRLGLGLMLFSPIILGAVFAVPVLLGKL